MRLAARGFVEIGPRSGEVLARLEDLAIDDNANAAPKGSDPLGASNVIVQPGIKVPALPGIIFIANFYLSTKLVQVRAVFRLSAAK